MATTKITPPDAAEKQSSPPSPSAPTSSVPTSNAPTGHTKGKSPSRPTPVKEKSSRLYSLDAYRGLIMITLAFGGFGLAGTAKNHLAENPDSPLWEAVLYNFSHVQWTGCGYWDLIQPSFMFMVGVSMAYSYTKRAALGQGWFRMFGHVIWRSIVLIMLGVFLSSNGKDMTNWSFMNVLSQIGLGYTFLFIFWKFPWKGQAFAAALILTWTWALYFFAPNTGIDIEKGDPEVKVSAEWAQENLKDIGPAWHKNANVGQQIDLYVLNEFPREEPFTAYRGGYQTLNFLPSLATMLFGLMCGELLRSSNTNKRKFWTLAIAGMLGLIIGQNVFLTDAIPMIKRIWTPTWVIFSTGWCCLILAALYGIVDILKWRWAFFPLVVVGMNSLVMYFMGQLLKPWTKGFLDTNFTWTKDLLKTDFLSSFFTAEAVDQFCEMNAPFIQATSVGIFLWLICWYLYRQKIFVRI